MRLMMVEARQGFRDPWVSALKTNGFGLDEFRLLAEAEEALRQIRYEMLLVNSELPDGDGIDWLRCRRESDFSTRLVVMTPAHDVENRVRALNAGIDDAVPDSLEARELVARMRALWRRSPIVRPDVIERGNVRIDTATREVFVDGDLVAMPRRELGILEHLLLSFNRTVTRDYLEGCVYGIASEVCSNSIEVRISRLRRWLTGAGANVEIKTLRGLGYRLQLQPTAGKEPVAKKMPQGSRKIQPAAEPFFGSV